MTRLTLQEKEIIIKAITPMANTIGAVNSFDVERTLYLRLNKEVQKEYAKRGRQ